VFLIIVTINGEYILSLNCINQLNFIKERACVLCGVKTEALYVIQVDFRLHVINTDHYKKLPAGIEMCGNIK